MVGDEYKSTVLTVRPFTRRPNTAAQQCACLHARAHRPDEH